MDCERQSAEEGALLNVASPAAQRLFLPDDRRAAGFAGHREPQEGTPGRRIHLRDQQGGLADDGVQATSLSFLIGFLCVGNW